MVSVLIGCSGWSYDDWTGRFYPVNIARKKEEWLRYYASFFTTVEINSTFYRPPHDFIVNGWIKKGLGLKGFEYSVKMPSEVTHEALARGQGAKAGILASAFEATCVRPLAENGLLGAALLQLPPGFRNDGEARKALAETLDTLDTDQYRYAVEFRHRTWLDDAGAPEPHVRKLLEIRRVANVGVDGPGVAITTDTTADHAYVRVHGRDHDLWSDQEHEDDIRLSRFDYLYSDAELEGIRDRIVQLSEKVSQVRVYFNNTAKAKGIRNALQLMDLLGIHHRGKEIPLQDQTHLGTFLMAKQ
ncbi:MAG: DUF72 domain-containing protein [Methanomassiliicoccus sp.]|nr:DUF72 domain-containing protein [Methanomassiliicoccus sp.]